MLTSLIENSKEVKDFRKSQGKRYSLRAINLGKIDKNRVCKSYSVGNKNIYTT
ncbi:hypothetical protein PL11201_1230001 [Planktothrix sp. PCC 11201]|nr:hypothetical protein PL11201_1230001 [Planktothrix sp. PCC 11201]